VVAKGAMAGRQRCHGSPNFLPCATMLNQLFDHKLGEQKAISGSQLFLSQLQANAIYKQLQL